MRFHSDGPDIPNELVAVQERGDIVFICGAGVSMTVGLPSFRKLVEDIYSDLGDGWSSHVAEADGMDTKAYDRVVRSLERRLGGDDGKSVQRVREQIRAAVNKALAPPATALDAHYDILTLSRDSELRNRLVTTNFDTLFERAWIAKKGASNPIKSHAGASMPGPLAAGFTGVMHLHGRVTDEELKLEESDLVLTSAEFGEAYLRSGWATRYIYDLVRATTVVIVGYTADDPPMRYLLEVIDADRERFKDLRPVYAFVAHDPDDSAKQCTLWKSKGAIPIPYETPTGTDHSKLYATLGVWARYAEDPTKWRGARMMELLAQPPEVATVAQLEEVKWLLSHADAGGNLGATNPSPDWMRKFSELGALRDSPPMLFWPWVIKNLENPAMIEACADCAAIKQEFFRALTFELSRRPDKIGKLNATAWHVLIRTRTEDASDWMNATFEAKRRLSAGDSSFGAVDALRGALRPHSLVRRVFRYGAKGNDAPPTKIGDILTVEFHAEVEQAGQQEFSALVRAVPQDANVEFSIIDNLLRMLMDSLDDAADSGFISPQYDRASHQIPSIAPHGQNEYSRGFYPVVRVIADLWERAANRDNKRGRKYAPWCLDQKYVLLNRLGLHFLTYNGVHDGAEAAEALKALSNSLFWNQARREQMKLTAERWNDFPQELRDALEARIIAGPPLGEA